MLVKLGRYLSRNGATQLHIDEDARANFERFAGRSLSAPQQQRLVEEATMVGRRELAIAGYVGELDRYAGRDDIVFFHHRVNDRELIVVIGEDRITKELAWLQTHTRTRQVELFEVLSTEVVLAGELALRN